MIAGRMNDIVRLLRPTVTTDSFGAETTSYTAGSPIHAEIQWKTGNTYETVGEFFPSERIEVLIRDQHEVGEKWRVQQLSGNGFLFHIRAIEPNRAKHMNRLICERVNE